MEIQYFKFEIFIPQTHLEVLRTALMEVDAGHIGNYDCCLSYSPVKGCFRPLEGTNPYIGNQQEICTCDELKVEVCVKAENVKKTKEAIKKVHPYEEPVINVLPLWDTGLE